MSFSNSTKTELIAKLIWDSPYKIGHWVGFTKLNEVNNEWLKKFLFSESDITLQGHRGSYKTTTLSLFFAINMTVRPNQRIILLRKTSSDVAEVLRQTAKILKTDCMNEIAKAVYGRGINIVKESSTELHTNLSGKLSGTSQLVGLGIGTSITGKHADIVATDDIVNINDRVSRAEREKTKLAYQELQNIKNPGGRFINTGTPWHPEDAFSIMPKPVKYDCYSTGLLSPEEIEALKHKMILSLFAANYELKHIASEDVIFPDPKVGADPCLVEQARYCHIDAAYDGADYTAFTICKKVGGTYYVFGKMWRKHVDDCEDEIIQYRRKFNAGRICVETNADKGYLAKELRRKGERVIEYHEDTNKFLKITSYLKGEWESVRFVQGTDNAYITQITEYNEDAEHDDAPDSLASIIRMLWGRRKDT